MSDTPLPDEPCDECDGTGMVEVDTIGMIEYCRKCGAGEAPLPDWAALERSLTNLTWSPNKNRQATADEIRGMFASLESELATARSTIQERDAEIEKLRGWGRTLQGIIDEMLQEAM